MSRKDATRYLERSRTRPGLLLRRQVLRRPRREDRELIRRLVRQIRNRQRGDGSWGGTVYDTAWAMWQLADLGYGANASARRGAEWLLARQGSPGAYRPEFFGTGPQRPSDQVTIFTGDRLSGANLLLGESCLAVRSLARIGYGRRREPQRALHALADLVRGEQHVRMTYPGQRVHGYCCARCTLGILEAFSLTPLREAGLARGALRWMANMQRPDGTWQRFPFYYALDVLGAYPHRLAREQVENALPALRRRQNADGSWGTRDPAEQTWIACRALATHDLL